MVRKSKKSSVKMIPAGDKSGGRMVRGRQRPDAAFPAAPAKYALPKGYAAVLADLKQRIGQERLRTVLAANAAMVMLYWDIGRVILQRQEQEGWGAGVVNALSHDLQKEFPDMNCFSRRNLLFMRSFACEFPDVEIVKQLVSQIPWGHIIKIMQTVKDSGQRLWYIQKTIENGWSRSILGLQIENQLHERQGRTVNNFPATLPPEQSDMAEQIFKDPYLFDFLGTADPRREREVEDAMVAHIQRFLLELGAGFAFVGRQVHLEVSDKDFYVDLLFYHLKLRCYIVVELKAVEFDPAFVGQMNLYLSAVDDLLRHPDDKPAIGLLLCKSKDKLIVEYALRNLNRPIGVAKWQTRLVRSLPKELKPSLPTIEEIEQELNEE